MRGEIAQLHRVDSLWQHGLIRPSNAEEVYLHGYRSVWDTEEQLDSYFQFYLPPMELPIAGLLYRRSWQQGSSEPTALDEKLQGIARNKSENLPKLPSQPQLNSPKDGVSIATLAIHKHCAYTL